MERRGSCIGRILGEYAGCQQQPEFYFDTNFFIMTLPNKDYGVDSKGLAEENKGFSEETFTDAQAELEQFCKKVLEALLTAKGKTIEWVRKLFRRYQLSAPLNANNMASLFEIFVVSASTLI